MASLKHAVSLLHRTVFTSLVVSLCLLATVGFSAAADPIDLNATALRLAAQRGGRITFKSGGTLAVTNAIVLEKDTVIDALDTPVTLNGQGGTNGLFIIHDADVTLLGLQIINFQQIGGPAVANSSGVLTQANPALGGAIYASNSTLHLRSCTVSNATALGGLGIHTTFFLVARPGAALGGAVFAVDSAVVIEDSAFLRCSVAGGFSGDAFYAGGSASGGALFVWNGSLTVSRSVFAENTAPGSGTRYELNSSGSGAAISLANVSAMIVDSSFRSNSAAVGGAIHTDSPLTLQRCGFDGNMALGPTSTFLGGAPALGGAVYQSTSNAITATATTFSRNQAAAGVVLPTGSGATLAFPAAGQGGAIYSAGPVHLTNSVLALNASIAGAAFDAGALKYVATASGGAIFCNGGALDYCTLASNYVGLALFGPPLHTNGSAGIFTSTNPVSLHATILSNEGTNAAGSFLDLGYNLSSDDSVPFSQLTSRTNLDARLEPFQIPDGIHGYLLPAADSPAIDAADPLAFPTEDLRQALRPSGTAPDIGAIERRSPQISARLAHGNLILTIVSDGQALTLERSSDLTHWPEAFTPENPAEFAVQPTNRYSFYRARLAP